jgi:hypothetical protein
MSVAHSKVWFGALWMTAAGLRLRAIRAGWLAVVLTTLAIFVEGLPARYTELLDTLHNLTPAQELVLQELGISGDGYARLVMAVEVAAPVVFFAMALLLFLRKPGDWVTVFVSATLITFVAWISPAFNLVATSTSIWQLPATLVQVVGATCALIFYFIFPDGRFVPRWTSILLIPWSGWMLAWVLFPGSPFDLGNTFRLPILIFPLFLTWWAIGIGAQIHRYRQAANLTQQQQTKLVLFAVAIYVLAYMAFGFDRFAVPVFGEPRHAAVVYDLIGAPFFQVIALLIPVAFAISILRYRLWDIDTLVNQALVYGVLTAIVAGLFPALLTLCQRIFIAFTGAKSDGAIVLTTLIFASSLTPLKNTLQSIVDRYVKPLPDPTTRAKALCELLQSFVEFFDMEQLARRTIDEAVQSFGANGGIISLVRDGRLSLLHMCGAWPQTEGISARLEYGGISYGRIVLGPRRTAQLYSPQDRESLEQLAVLVAQTAWLHERLGLNRGQGTPAVLPAPVGRESEGL